MTPHQIIGIGLGLYFNCFVCVGLFDLPKQSGYGIGSALGLVVVAYALFVHGWNVPGRALNRWLALLIAFTGIVGGSFLVNADSYNMVLTFKAVGYVSLFVISSAVAVLAGHRSARACLLTYLLGLVAAIAVTVAVNNVNSHNGRLLGPYRDTRVQTSGLHANEVGLLGLTAVLLSTRLGWRGVMLLAPIGAYVAYRSGCRGALVGIVIAIPAFVVAKEVLARSIGRAPGDLSIRSVRVVWALLIMVCVTGAVVGPFLIDDVLLLNDERRGLSSGFTGRSEQWGKLVDHWMENPVIGKGYSVVRNEALKVGDSVDGGFLMVLAELGLAGLLFFAMLFVGAIRITVRAIRTSGSSNAATYFVFLVVFGFVNVFESRIVGAGSIGIGLFFYIVTLCLVRSDAELNLVEENESATQVLRRERLAVAQEIPR